MLRRKMLNKEDFESYLSKNNLKLIYSNKYSNKLRERRFYVLNKNNKHLYDLRRMDYYTTNASYSMIRLLDIINTARASS